MKKLLMKLLIILVAIITVVLVGYIVAFYFMPMLCQSISDAGIKAMQDMLPK